MLQRAASNAYSWWWASHIRTKQSKWLEQSLQDMEEKVTQVLKLIEEDGDSFAKRAEMYYRKRPELIHFVEESYRAFRALAERYDLMSKELQNANSTLASAFPDQYQFDMDDDDDGSPQLPPKRSVGNNNNPNIPNVPKHFPTRKIKAIMALTSKNPPSRFNVGGRSGNKPVKTRESGLTKAEALDEIDKLQKAILTKQTEKEFTKSSYETGVAKYWEIEQEITEMQERVSKLQDEFGVGKDIEDNEARTLMLGAALKSCQDTLAQLQEKQERSAVEAREERLKIMDARHKLLSFKGQVLGEEGAEIPKIEQDSLIPAFDEGASSSSSSKGKELEMLRDKIKEHFEVESSLSVSDMADKIDELVGKVINLESAVSSQTAVIQRLRVETDELQQHIRNLEHDKANLIDGKNTLSDKVKEMEDKLSHLQELESSVQSTNTHLQMQFTDASSNLDDISHKLPNVKLDQLNELIVPEEGVTMAVAEVSSSPEESALQSDVHQEAKPEQDASVRGPEIVEQLWDSSPAVVVEQLRDSSPAAVVEEVWESSPASVVVVPVTRQEADSRKDQADEPEDKAAETVEKHRQGEDEPNWQELFMNGLEGKEKVILNEYTSILRNYKDVKKKLGEVEDMSENSLTELRGLEVENAKKDEEIHSLRQKLILLQQKLQDYNSNKKVKEMKEDSVIARRDPQVPSPEREDDILNLTVEEPRTISAIEEKLRADLDEILEENLDFWMRFSSSFSQVQKLQSEIEDLQKELAKIENEKKKKKKEGSSTPDRSLKSDVRPIYKHLKQIQTELTVWLEKSVELKEELKCRFSQLCGILEDISRALSDGAVDEEMKFTSYQAAKFQGEVLNMQQENQKVEDELQAAVDHVTNLQVEVERTITRLNDELGISGSKSTNQMRDGGSRNRIPLGAFIFGSKTKKHKQSILSSIHPSWHKKH